MEWVLVLLVALAVVGFVVIRRRNKAMAAERAARELGPVKKLAFEDVTALGVHLQDLDLELAGLQLDGGGDGGYQSARAWAARAGSPPRARTPTTNAPSTPTRRPRPPPTRSPAPSRWRTSPRSSRTAATRSPACRPGSRVTRCRSGGRRASSTRGTGCRSTTSRSPRPVARSGGGPPGGGGAGGRRAGPGPAAPAW